MRAPAAQFQTDVAADKIPAAWLIELQASTYVRYAIYPSDVVFDGDTFTGTSGTVGTQEQNIEGQAPKLSLKLQNVDGVIATWLASSDRRGTVVALILVITTNLSDPTAAISEEYEIDGYSWDESEATIQLSASPILRGAKVPGRRIQAFYCTHSYKGRECGYNGSLSTCDFTYDGANGCVKHFGTAPKRFGGCIGVVGPEVSIS